MSTVNVPSTTTEGITYELAVDAAGRAHACTCLGHVNRGTCKHVNTHNGFTPKPRPTVLLPTREERIAKRDAQAAAQVRMLVPTIPACLVTNPHAWGDPLSLLDFENEPNNWSTGMPA